MSDGPVKLSPSVEPEPLDDIILGEDDESADAAAVRARSKPSVPPAIPPRSAPPASVKGSVPPGPPTEKGKPPSASTLEAADPSGEKEPKKRSKMTLRIPDDEISRPELPVTTPAGGVPAARDDRFDDAPPIKPQRIISAGGADDTLELPSEEVRSRMAAITNETNARAIGIDTTDERGWTPYQPSVADAAPAPPAVTRNGGATIVDPRERIPSAPPSEEIPIDVGEVGDVGDVADSSTDDLATRPRLPEGPDSEEIKIEDGEPEPEPEIEADDLVSVESLPRGAAASAGKENATNTLGKYPAFKPPGTTASALMAIATPPPGVVAPSNPPPPPAVSPRGSSPALSVDAPAGAFRPPQHAVIMPSVGGLAPPPMSETAAVRKKARPWWEELFNDDFIRTMAKVSESQIKGEVDFIEDSLGCEAGAMVLDLACGTGRHAVELATRGYQVVGFDLSLAMLARASDEAQERKQKINFVQGDMRDMTFGETFDGVYAWNTSFGFFDEEKNAAVIAKVHKSLKKGGQFLLDVINRDYIVRQAPSLAWFEGDGCICMDEMQIDFITSRMKVKRTLMMDDGRTKEIEYSIRVYALHELGKMLHDNGFRVAEVSGRTGTPGVFFGCESPRTLILAEKR